MLLLMVSVVRVHVRERMRVRENIRGKRDDNNGDDKAKPVVYKDNGLHYVEESQGKKKM